MPVGIVEVINNTTGLLHYQNLKSGYTFTLPPLSHAQADSDAWLPKSTFHDDTVPYKSSGKYINVWINNGPKVEISDDNWMFSLVVPTDNLDKAEKKVASLSNGGQYILKVDQAAWKQGSVDFIKYEYSKFQATDAGFVISQTLLQSSPTIGQALLDLFV
ncbi:hypothetical protein GALMADRAFT_138730 [Galerina marginata CBS 339.88]|uniref:Uncharacterized protein n=1 Tax=Galerina marginata (strain CBS 339.88) TaxID=685588 RepID=A0A067TCM9_GALM3|nr:hypothetical protein GALMADRAFT_138730 [Galerina marginata CBS 339.88]